MSGRAWALVVSLALNLFLAGVLVGNWVAERAPAAPPPAEGGPALFRSLHHMMRSLPPAERDGVRRAVAAHQAEIHDRQAALREARRSAAEAMEAETFDPAAAAVAFAALRERTAAAQAAIHQALIDAAAELPPEDRRRLVEAAAGGHGPPPDHGPPPGREPRPPREPPPNPPPE